MIRLERRLLRRLRSVFTHSLGVTTRSAPPAVEIRTDGRELALRAGDRDAAIEFRQADASPSARFVVPFDVFKTCEGTDGDVGLERRGHEIVANWSDADVPQSARLDARDDFDFPPLPERWESHGPDLLDAFREAGATTDDASVRFALGCLQLRGPEGTIAASDSRQLLIQRGFSFPWNAELLVPANRAFALRDLRDCGSVEIGRSDDWVALRTGPLTLHLKIVTDARFPRIDHVVPDPEYAKGTLHLSEADAAFLLRTLPRLALPQQDHSPLTVDLNGSLAVRGRLDDQSPLMELVLTGSRRSGADVVSAMSRDYLLRALALGFREVHFFEPNSPLCCRDDRRTYAWAPQDADGALAASPDAVRIASPGESASTPSNRKPRRTMKTTTPLNSAEPIAPTATNAPASAAAPANGAPRRERKTGTAARGADKATVLDQADSLRATLQQALDQTRGLISVLRERKRQSKLVKATLASLRQLEAVDV